MAIDYERLMSRRFPPIEHHYTSKDCILYALGLGIGENPTDASHLRVLYERAMDFAALPSMVNVLAYPGFWAMEPDTGLTWQKILHGEQSLTLHAPLPVEGTVVGNMKVTGIVDKGVNKGALIYSEREITDKSSGSHIATITSTSFALGDGGFGGPDTAVKPAHPLPDREPDLFHDFKTSTRNALIYRLSGDLNPLHADPSVAEEAGFDQPILHGLCSLGVSSWAITAALRNGNVSDLKHLQLRFSAPVYPGETIRTEIWEDGEQVSFRARVVERDVVVLNNGLATLHKDTQ